MTLTEQIYTQALLLSRDVEDENLALLKTLCRSAEISLRAKMRTELNWQDCKADFIAAASMYALAALSELKNTHEPEQVKLGDLTVRRSGKDAAICCLRYQAELMISPYLQDSFTFKGV